MNDREERKVVWFQEALLILNVLAVSLICVFIYATTNRILSRYDARTFLDRVASIPENPGENLIICLLLMGVLIVTFLLRRFCKGWQNRWIILTLILDMIVSGAVIYQLDFNYNGLLLLVFANVIAYAKDGKLKILFVVMAIAGYLVADYELLSIYFPMYNLNDYIGYYSSETQKYLLSIYNIILSLNIILFIVYCIYVINAQRGTLEQINQLYHELQDANTQLKEYADMAERMAQTRERNRLAREIHDTLGHTLTSIAAGLDACLALINTSPQALEAQLELLAKVSREGIKDVRRSVNELRPDSLERLSLEEAIRRTVSDMCQASGVQIDFDTEEKHLKFDEDEENAIYRVIQESITNAVRHGKAGHIWISLRRTDGDLLLVIRDDGAGCAQIESGFGTKHIKERIEMLGGTVAFDGRKGFTVTAHIPIRWGEEYD